MCKFFVIVLVNKFFFFCGRCSVIGLYFLCVNEEGVIFWKRFIMLLCFFVFCFCSDGGFNGSKWFVIGWLNCVFYGVIGIIFFVFRGWWLSFWRFVWCFIFCCNFVMIKMVIVEFIMCICSWSILWRICGVGNVVFWWIILVERCFVIIRINFFKMFKVIYWINYLYGVVLVLWCNVIVVIVERIFCGIWMYKGFVWWFWLVMWICWIWNELGLFVFSF